MEGWPGGAVRGTEDLRLERSPTPGAFDSPREAARLSDTVGRRRSLMLSGIALCALAACSEAPPERPTPPSIVLITLDTARADRLGAYGNRDGLTPTLDRLAREGVVFQQAIAPTPITLPSHVSILTGVLPPQHGVRDNTYFTLEPEARLVAEAMKRAGYRTAAFVGAVVLHAGSGLDQGFERYSGPSPERGGSARTGDPVASREARRPADSLYVERPANEVVSDALDWIHGLETYERFFVWLHLYDPHAPYEPPERFKTRFENPYDGEIAFCDEQLGRLLEELDKSGHAENLLTVVTSDHGEGLGEHNEGTHGLLLYQSTLSVPLLFHGGPVSRAGGTRISQPVSTADVAQTLVALAQLPPDSLSEAHTPALFAESGEPLTLPDDRALYLETLLPYHSYRWSAWRGLLWRGHKFVEGPSSHLFALEPDPSEQRDLAQFDPDTMEQMRARLSERVAQLSTLGWNAERQTAAGEEEMLRSLGYVAGSVGEDPFAPGLPNPADRVGDLRRYWAFESLLVRAKAILPKDPAQRKDLKPKDLARALRFTAKAETILDELHAVDPGNPHVAMRLGTAKYLLGKHAEAIPLFEQTARIHPEDTGLQYHLALSYEAEGQTEAARQAMSRAGDYGNQPTNR